MASRHSDLTPQKIQDYCDLRLAAVLPSAEVANLCRHPAALLERGEYPPYRGGSLDTRALAGAMGIDASQLSAARAVLKPIFDAVSRAVTERRLRPPKPPRIRRAHPNAGRKARLIEEFPAPLQDTWEEPRRFAEALRLQPRSPGWKPIPNDRITSSPSCAMRFMASGPSNCRPMSVSWLSRIWKRPSRKPRLPGQRWRSAMPMAGPDVRRPNATLAICQITCRASSR